MFCPGMSKVGLLVCSAATNLIGCAFFCPEFKFGLGRRYCEAAGLSPEQEILRNRDKAYLRKRCALQFLINTLLVMHTLCVFHHARPTDLISMVKTALCAGLPFICASMSITLWERKRQFYWINHAAFIVISQVVVMMIYKRFAPAKGWFSFA